RWRALKPGDRVEVSSKSGNTYAATLVAAGRDEAGLYVRLANGLLARLLPSRLNWKTLKRLGTEDAVKKGDEAILIALGGDAKRGKLVDVLDDRVVLSLPKGGTQTVAVGGEEEKRFRLLFPATDLRKGDEFIVQSVSGREFHGIAVSVAPDKIVAEMRPSRAPTTLRVDRLDLKTLHVLIPVRGVTTTWS
ncbi:MAG: hypothetical protein ACAI25_07260, partial [Planctomycetota bacterium]